jgi:hypothetical protein
MLRQAADEVLEGRSDPASISASRHGKDHCPPVRESTQDSSPSAAEGPKCRSPNRAVGGLIANVSGVIDGDIDHHPRTVSRSSTGGSVRILVVVAGILVATSDAWAVDPFEIQVYDGTVNPPGTPGIELHVNSVISGRREAVPPELPPNHQTHFTVEPSIGIRDWWEVGGYLQTTLRADGTFDYAGDKLRTKLVWPARGDSPFRWGVNLEVSRLPEQYDRNRWGGEIRPIATWTSRGGNIFASFNPIVDLSLAGPGSDEMPSFQPAATTCYVIDGVMSAGLEYYADLGPIGRWLPASAQEHYVFEVINVLDWKHVELNFGAGEGLTQASNRFVGKMILGFR